jgi:osmoprotectant transport system permease protein
VAEILALLPGYATAHLQLSLAALVLGVACSVPLGVWVTRHSRFEPGVLGAASVLQTVPSLALLALMVPLLAGLGVLLSGFGVELRSIGFLPAVVALTLYSVLPILRNTVTGIGGVDPALVEAARGVGMTERQRLWRVELPLALPVIVAGVRTATVWVVGTATLATPVGATSLGNYIFSGLQTRNFRAVLVGSVAAAALALTLDGLVRLLESGLVGRSGRRIGVAAASLAALALYAGGAFLASAWGAVGPPVVVGAKTFTEQYILAELLAAVVERDTGVETRLVQSLGSTVAFDALREGQIDAYVEYSGTVWATIMRRKELPDDRRAVLADVEAFLAREHGVRVVAALGFENTYALAMRQADARARGVRRLSDLARAAPDLAIGGDYEFFARAEWRALESVYGLHFRETRSMDSALMYQAAAAEEVDVISAYSTDGRVAAFGLVLLDDDRGVIPPYDAIVLASPRLVAERPDVVEALADLAGRLDEARMQALNHAVDQEGRAPREVARAFLAGTAAGAPGEQEEVAP